MRRTVLKLLLAGAMAIAGSGTALAQDAADENILLLNIASNSGDEIGTVEIELFAEKSPGHVDRIKQLARAGAYDDVVFHRVIDGFMVQTGDVQFGTRTAFADGRAGMGGSDMPDLAAEFSDISHEEGIVSMARAQNPNSANSQFFIMLAHVKQLDGQYSVFGKVLSGMEHVHAIKKGSRSQNGAVAEPDYIASARIKSDG